MRFSLSEAESAIIEQTVRADSATMLASFVRILNRLSRLISTSGWAACRKNGNIDLLTKDESSRDQWRAARKPQEGAAGMIAQIGAGPDAGANQYGRVGKHVR